MDTDDDRNQNSTHHNDNTTNYGSSTGAVMSESEQKQRRNSIRDILADDNLTPFEKRKSIQSLMDGRRRSSTATHSSEDGSRGGEMYRAAQEAAAFYTSDTEDDPMDDGMAAGAAQYEYAAASNDESTGPQHRRKERSTSLPGWSERGMHAPKLVSSAGNPNDGNSVWNDPINVNRRMEMARPPCTHYERNCTIISPCCGLAFGCRICHDECPSLPPPLPKRPAQDTSTPCPPPPPRVNWDSGDTPKRKQEKRPSLPLGFEEEVETHHQIDRFAIAEIICRLCYTRQSSKRNFCIACKAQFGGYHCKVCNLWMSDDERPYHCNKCGFCRVGGKENFRHCDDCGMCIDTLLFDDHNCKAGKYMSNCPVCQEDLFSSRDASHEMPCGHAIHWHCFKELTSYDTRCPVCKKTAETPEHMAPTWQAIAMGIALQPVPPELARVVTIICNDCENLDEDRRWHFLGVRCRVCTSFNTTVERTTMTGRDAALFLDELEALGRSNANTPHTMDES